jgi:CheY-like chemotaxis protein
MTTPTSFSVLISEDDPTDQFLLKQIIKEISETIDINIVYNCEQLLDFLLKDELQRKLNRQTFPDLIISTYSKPFCDLKIIVEIRKRERLRHIPIYLFVNEKIDQTRSVFLDAGVSDVFRKPDTYLQLKEKIEELFATVRSGKL